MSANRRTADTARAAMIAASSQQVAQRTPRMLWTTSESCQEDPSGVLALFEGPDATHLRTPSLPMCVRLLTSIPNLAELGTKSPDNNLAVPNSHTALKKSTRKHVGGPPLGNCVPTMFSLSRAFFERGYCHHNTGKHNNLQNIDTPPCARNLSHFGRLSDRNLPNFDRRQPELIATSPHLPNTRPNMATSV